MHSAATRHDLLAHSPPREPGFVRQVGEAIILLALAVTLFRTFLAEGYMISTGSMAPSLLGYHRRSVCPSCQLEFARGTTVTADDAGMQAAAGGGDADEWSPNSCRCPNCGASVPAEQFPRNEGDQLLVQKHTYAFRNPRRFEVAVFRNPRQPMQAYVKRVVGLPGESIELSDGDVYADGVLQRKSLSTQLGMRILVDDAAHRPQGEQGTVQRWQPDRQSDWAIVGDQFQFNNEFSRSAASTSAPQWVTYHHWICRGGTHQKVVDIDAWPPEIGPPVLFRDHFELTPDGTQLRSVGVISQEVYATWSTQLSGTSIAQPFRELFDLSHEAPISDVYGYNHPHATDTEFVVGDLMLELDVDFSQSKSQPAQHGAFYLTLSDGRHQFDCEFDLSRGLVRLRSDGKDRILREASLPDSLLTSGKGRLLFSVFDRQVLLAVDEIELFEPLLFAASETSRNESSVVRFGASTGNVRVSNVRLYRDVYYTPGERWDAYELGDDEFFVLGDNSPVSVDSRVWEDPAVPRHLLIGKPLVVHLPSRQVSIPMLTGDSTIRVPDFSRVRTIR